MVKQDRPDDVRRRQTRKRLLWLVGAVIVAALLIVLPSLSDAADDYTGIEEHFKYGSIGSEPANGIPYWIWQALPVLFADKLPGKGYGSLGFIYEAGRDRPVGFSKRRVFIDRIALNCGVCHTGTVRDTPDGSPRVITGMPANTMNLMNYTKFLIAAAQDERFSPDQMLDAIKQVGGNLGPIERFIYRRYAIPQTREALLGVATRLEFLKRQPDWGPGRVDTFNPYKALQFNFPMAKLGDEEIIGTVDLPSIWMQRPREGMQLHWDGDNTSVEERNKPWHLGVPDIRT